MSSQNLKNIRGGNEEPSHGPTEPLRPLIDLEENDDDIIECSAGDFEEAVANARRTRRRTRDYINMEAQTILTYIVNVFNDTPMLQPIDDIYINLKESDVVENATRSIETMKVHGFKCPICMAPFVEEMTTRCGHIFCKKCIKTALSANRVCPTCGKNATPRGLLRVYLP